MVLGKDSLLVRLLVRLLVCLLPVAGFQAPCIKAHCCLMARKPHCPCTRSKVRTHSGGRLSSAQPHRTPNRIKLDNRILPGFTLESELD